jgi:hypothetical protein
MGVTPWPQDCFRLLRGEHHGFVSHASYKLSSLLRKVPDAGHPLAQDCFRLLEGELLCVELRAHCFVQHARSS